MNSRRTILGLLCCSMCWLVVGQADDDSVPKAVTERDTIVRRDVADLLPQLVEIRRDLHRHPELSNQEERTAKIVAQRLRAAGLEVTTGVAGHGVVALLKGSQPGRCIAVRADMDALPIQEMRETSYRSQIPGVMHACGHDVHTAAVLGLAELLAKHRELFRGSVKFLFQPAEEALPATYVGDWGAARMLREGALDNPRPEAIFALHCTPRTVPLAGDSAGKEVPLRAGQIGYCIGPASAISDRFQIVIKGKTAHGASPQQGIDAIVVAAEAITSLQTIRSRQIDTREPLVLTIGTIHGGARENIIADRVELGGTLRAYSEPLRDRVIELMHRSLKGITESHGATYELTYRKGYPSIHNHPVLARRALPSLQRIVGESNLLETQAGMGGEDFSYFARVIPGFYFRLGVANPDKGITAGVHTPDFDIDESSLQTAVESLAALVCDFLATPL